MIHNMQEHASRPASVHHCVGQFSSRLREDCRRQRSVSRLQATVRQEALENIITMYRMRSIPTLTLSSQPVLGPHLKLPRISQTTQRCRPNWHSSLCCNKISRDHRRMRRPDCFPNLISQHADSASPPCVSFFKIVAGQQCLHISMRSRYAGTDVT